MAKTIFLMNGPNLNLLGQRQPEIYGYDTLEDVTKRCTDLAKTAGIDVKAMQSNHEGQLVDWIHEARHAADVIIFNPGAYSHTSIAIFDALQAFDGLVLEVHVSNIHRRESFRHHSYVSQRAEGVIAGFGVEGYEMATRRAISLLSKG